MVKNDLEMFVTACIIALMLILANFGTVSKDIDSLYTELQTFKESESYKSYLAFKNEETSYWAHIKGTKASNHEIADILKVANPVEVLLIDSSNVQPITPPLANAAKIATPVKFLLIGDSMMLVGFGPALENALLEYKEVSVVREGAFSTGLNRIDYYDWYSKTDELIAFNKPDILVVMFGANDGQRIVDRDGKSHDLGSNSWDEVYRQRVNMFLTRTSPEVKKIYWVSHPIPGNDNFMSKFSTMNLIYKSEIAKFPNVVYLNSWDRFAVNGVYRQSIPDDNGLWQIAKQSDGVHVTDFGGKILAGLVIKEALKDIEMK